jgi:hypothetical protein
VWGRGSLFHQTNPDPNPDPNPNPNPDPNPNPNPNPSPNPNPNPNPESLTLTMQSMPVSPVGGGLPPSPGSLGQVNFVEGVIAQEEARLVGHPAGGTEVCSTALPCGHPRGSSHRAPATL